MLRLTIIVLMFLPAFFLCRQAQAQSPNIIVSVKNDSIDVCGAGKRSLIIVYVQEISVQDSIFGYDIELRYTPDKLYLTDEIFSGTLTEQFADHKLTFPEPGIARGWAANFSRPITTQQKNQPLIAVAGEYRGDCDDTVQVRISAISFSHVQDNDVVDIEGSVENEAVVTGYIADKPERRVQLVSDSSSIHLEDVAVSHPVTLQLKNGIGRNIRSLDIEIAVTNPQQFAIRDIESASSGVEIMESREESNGLWFVQLAVPEIWSTELLMKLKIASLANKNDTGTVVVRPVQVSTCGCVSQLLGSSIELQSTEKIEVGVEEVHDIPQVFIEQTGNGWYIRKTEGALGSIRIATVLGQQILQMDELTEDSIYIDNSTWSRTLYLIQVGSDQQRKTILIEKL
jgi:hypothetical protein